MHQLLLTTINNPFLSLPPSFRAKHASIPNGHEPTHTESISPGESHDADVKADTEVEIGKQGAETERQETIYNEPVLTSEMFRTDPEEIQGDWLKKSIRFQNGMKRIGDLLSGGRV